MSVVSVIGNVDKRIIVYPLVRALSIDGKTLVVTEDTSLKRLYSTNSNQGCVDGVDIEVVPDIEDVGGIDTYKHIVVVSNEYIDKNSTEIFYCRGLDKSFEAETLVNKIDSLKDEEEGDNNLITEIVLTGNPIKQKLDNLYVLCLNDYKYLNECEEFKTLKPFKNPSIIKILASKGSSLVGLNEKQFEGLFYRERYIEKIK